MNAKNYYQPLNLSEEFLKNIQTKTEQNDNETKVYNYENSHINPKFRYYLDDTNLNLTPKFAPDYSYKNKSMFGREKPSQTEHDEIAVSESYLNSHFGYTDYGNFKVANQSLPERNKHKTTPKNNLYDLFSV
jgi:hypothetical protein